MLIEVQDDVLKKALKESDPEHEQAVEALRHLAWSIRRNHHLVFFPSLDLQMLNGLEKYMNKVEIKAIRHSYSRRQDLKVLLGFLTYHVLVSFSINTTLNGNVICINPGDSQLELFEESHLLTENILDATFYEYVAQAYQKLKRIDEHSFRINYFPLQGGGSTTGQVFVEECKRGQHLCLAILDSDKKWPNYDGFGPTANRFSECYSNYISRNVEPITCKYCFLQKVNEIENLIPLYIIKVFSNTKEKEFIDNYPDALPWFDMKKGLEYRMLDNKEAFDGWKQVIPDKVDWDIIDSIIKASRDHDDYVNNLSTAGLKPVVEPWGKSILENVLFPKPAQQRRYDLQNIDWRKLTPPQKQDWETIGSLIFNWCCCFRKTVF